MRIHRIREILLINKIPIIQLRLWRFVIRVERYIFFFFSFFIFCHRQTDTRVLVDVRRLYMTQTRQLLDQKEKKTHALYWRKRQQEMFFDFRFSIIAQSWQNDGHRHRSTICRFINVSEKKRRFALVNRLSNFV